MTLIHVKNLDAFAGKTYCLAKVYEDCRRKAGQYGYKVFDCADTIDCNGAVWKTFGTVVSFLESLHWTVGWKQVHWQGYVKFVFSQLSPTIPQAGQLKNKLLVKEYLTSVELEEIEPVRSPEEMERIYKRCLHPTIAQSSVFQELIGVKSIVGASNAA